MTKLKQEAVKKFAQVSLSSDFAALVRGQADSSHRSMAAQLEHWAQIAQALEAVIPAPTLGELKGGKDPGEVLSRLGAFLVNQNPSLLHARLATAKSPRYGVDEADPEVAIRIDPDGTTVRGVFDAAGNFIPAKAATVRIKPNVHRQTSKNQQSRSTAGSRDNSRAKQYLTAA